MLHVASVVGVFGEEYSRDVVLLVIIINEWLLSDVSSNEIASHEFDGKKSNWDEMYKREKEKKGR